MLEICMHRHEHFGPSLQHPACKHQDLLSGPPRGVSSTGSPQKASAPDPVRSGCPATDFLQFIGIFFCCSAAQKEVFNRECQEQVSLVR